MGRYIYEYKPVVQSLNIENKIKWNYSSRIFKKEFQETKKIRKKQKIVIAVFTQRRISRTY